MTKQASPWPDRPCAESSPSEAALDARVARLRALIWEGLHRRAPHHGSGGATDLFAGSYDWHSAVHAHWALLSMARGRGDAPLEAALRTRLSAEAIAAERAFLGAAENAAFELPYGRAWLLLLLDELSRRPWCPESAALLRGETEAAVLSWIEAAPYPEKVVEGAPAFDATHGSLLFAFLLLALSRPATPDAQARMRAVLSGKIAAQRGALPEIVAKKIDFLDLWAVQAVIDRVFRSEDATLTASASPRLATRPYPLRPEAAFEPTPFDKWNAHTPGAAMVRLWPYAIEGGAGDSAAAARFHSRMNEMFHREDQWADSFRFTSHWVPQFMWMALWLEAGRP